MRSGLILNNKRLSFLALGDGSLDVSFRRSLRSCSAHDMVLEAHIRMSREQSCNARLLEVSLQMLLTSCSAHGMILQARIDTLREHSGNGMVCRLGCCSIGLVTLELGLLPKFMLNKKLMLFLDLDDGTSQWLSLRSFTRFSGHDMILKSPIHMFGEQSFNGIVLDASSGWIWSVD